MREPYLLAASLLTGLAIPASALPQMSSIPSTNSGFLKDGQQESYLSVGGKIISSVNRSVSKLSSQTVSPFHGSQSMAGEQVIPSFEGTVPEFSHQVVSRGASNSPSEQDILNIEVLLSEFRNKFASNSINSAINSHNQEASPKVVSGSQLYYQRLASLKTGQIYTRVDDSNLDSLWGSARRHKLTYEDWKSLLAMEAKAIAQGQGTNRLSILIGDSLSMWFPRESLPVGKLWLNQGISGDTSGGVFRRLSAFANTRPEAIYVMVGINDLRKGASDTVILQNYQRILKRLRQTHPETRIIVQSILPVRWKSIPNSRIRKLNGQIAKIAKTAGANYLNIHNWFTDGEGNLRTDLTTDGLHLSAQGYDVWRSALQKIEFRLAQRQS